MLRVKVTRPVWRRGKKKRKGAKELEEGQKCSRRGARKKEKMPGKKGKNMNGTGRIEGKFSSTLSFPFEPQRRGRRTIAYEAFSTTTGIQTAGEMVQYISEARDWIHGSRRSPPSPSLVSEEDIHGVSDLVHKPPKSGTTTKPFNLSIFTRFGNGSDAASR